MVKRYFFELFTTYIRSDLFDREIFSDASLTGWRVVCDGIRTHGFWSTQDE